MVVRETFYFGLVGRAIPLSGLITIERLMLLVGKLFLKG
ncbi:hypothetical protein CPTD_01515 [Corynebacterium pseudotuberculosis]|nr:Hypothetical protein BFF96_1412 [Corynebacterium pseudotuberculosis]KEX87876.1 hypothetical protein CPTD_01515 [Corynebacterium pseudotuberculosis]